MKNAIEVMQPSGYKFVPLSKLHLANALFSQYGVTIRDSSGISHNGRLQRVTREDGSGSSFNIDVTPSNPGATKDNTFHVRTVD